VTGRSPGELLRQRVAGPLGADVHLGLPATEDHRVASFLWPGEPPAEAETERDDGQPNEPLELMRYNAYSNPSGLSGAGGALEDITVVDPVALADSGVALGYVMNQLGPRWQKPRNRTLIDAVYQSLAGTVGTTFSSEVRTGNR
jgi:CubicO group peptidase (beta-lactamase class C family)